MSGVTRLLPNVSINCLISESLSILRLAAGYVNSQKPIRATPDASHDMTHRNKQLCVYKLRMNDQQSTVSRSTTDWYLVSPYNSQCSCSNSVRHLLFSLESEQSFCQQYSLFYIFKAFIFNRCHVYMQMTLVLTCNHFPLFSKNISCS